VGEDLSLEGDQVRPRVDAELVGEHPAHPPVRRQGVRLPPGPVQRGDQQRPQPLAEGMDGDQGLQLADGLPGRPEGEAGGQLVLPQPQPGLLEPDPMREDPLGRPGGRQHLRPEQVQCLRAGGRRGDGAARCEECGTFPGQSQHAKRVHRLGLHGERVAGGAGRQRGRVAEGPAQLRDLGLEGVAPDPGDLGPEFLDQPLGPHGPPGVQRQAHQQHGGQAARHGRGHALAAHLHPAQHRHGEHRASLGPSGRRQPVVSAALDALPMAPTPPREQHARNLLAAALYTPDRPDLLVRAAELATSTRDRQLVAIAAAHLQGDDDRALLLARDHLADHPDAVLVAHIAALSTRH
jgi:hypothetical protein